MALLQGPNVLSTKSGVANEMREARRVRPDRDTKVNVIPTAYL
jgi:hypothetical protein